MKLANIPDKIPLPFASAGGKRSIPVESQIGTDNGAASLTDGFPPLTRTNITAGGIPPNGLDMNGILFEMSAIDRWNSSGGAYPYDATFAGLIGGYPKGATVLRTDGEGSWLNLADDNASNPESGGTNWAPGFTSGAASIAMTNANVTLTNLQAGRPVIVITGTLTANLNLIFPTYVKGWVVINNTTGAFNITAKTAAGAGVVVAQGSASEVVGDGTNILNVNSQTQLNQASITGAFKKLQLSANGTNANVVISADLLVVTDGSGNSKTLSAVSVTNITSASGVNGFDTGPGTPITASSWNYVWVIHNGTATASLTSLSATAPTLPGGYTYKALVGVIRTDASGNKYPISFKQFGADWQYALVAGSNLALLPQMASGVQGSVGTTTVAVAVGNFVPPIGNRIRGEAYNGTTNVQVSPNAIAPYVGGAGLIVSLTSSQQNTFMFDFALESTNIYYAGATANSEIRCLGFKLNI